MTTGININHVCIKLIKTSLLSGELFDTSLPTAEDLDLCVRLYEKTDRYVFINSVLYRYNRTGYSLTGHDNGDAYIRRTSEYIRKI